MKEHPPESAWVDLKVTKKEGFYSYDVSMNTVLAATTRDGIPWPEFQVKINALPNGKFSIEATEITP